MFMKRLILFDIDETMISSDGAGRRAIGKALASMFNIGPESITVSMSGKTDPQILSEILTTPGVDIPARELESRLEEMYELYLGLLEEELAAARRYIIHEGVQELLDVLTRQEGAFLGLLTGNIEPGARLKLQRFDLNRYFPTGAYGSDSADRMKLPPIARERAGKHYRCEFVPEELVIIGDSIYDVMCARGYGARSIAVNTGVTTREALEEQSPDHLFPSLSDTDAVMKAIFA